MNTIATFRKCTLNNEELLKRTDEHIDNLYKTGKIPARHIPARPDYDFDLLAGELILRYQELLEENSHLNGIYLMVCDSIPEDHPIKHSNHYKKLCDKYFKTSVIVGYKCKICGTEGKFNEFPSFTTKDEDGLKDSDTFCKNPECEGKNEDLIAIEE